MKLASIVDNGQKKCVASVNDRWYDLQKLSPYSNTSSLRALIARPDGVELLKCPNLESARISTPEQFALPYRPRQIVCVGRNYAAHTRELGNAIPTSPLLFNKLPSSCIGDEDFVEFSPEIGRVDYEGEVGVVIGRPLENCSQEDAYDAIFGYTLVNDLTARDIQQNAKENGHPWLMAKSMATFCPFGPYITTRNDLPWPLEVNIELSVNGRIRQSGNTSQFIFNIPTLISYISSYIPLFSGDIIATGTPEGVGSVQEHDLVELSASGLGTLRNRIRHQ